MAEWIISSNLKIFRTDDALRELEELSWYQSKPLVNVQVGDTIYIYISSPVRELHWKCLVTDVMSMEPAPVDDSAYYQYDISSVTFTGPYIILKRVYEFTLPDLVSFQKLKENGLTTRLMGPYRVNPQLSAYLAKVEAFQQDENNVRTHISSLPSNTLKQLAKRYSGAASKKQSTVISFRRNPYIAQYAKMLANGFCQLCGKAAPFMDQNDEPYLESHHVIWLSKGGADSVNNVVALCPNCHRKMHVLNDETDIAKLKAVLAKR